MAYIPSEKFADPSVEREFRKVAITLNNIIVGKAQVLHVAPVRVSDGAIVICDGVDWNPLGDGIKRPIWYDVSAGVWKKFA